MKAVIPAWAHDGGTNDLLRRLQNPTSREKIKEEISRNGIRSIPTVKWSDVVIARVSTEGNKKLEGQSVTAIANALGKEECDVVFDLLVEEEGKVKMILFGWSEEGVRKVMGSPAGMIASDGSSLCITGPLSEGKPHPRNYGTFVRVLGKYVRDEKVLTLQEAIRQMTSAPANRLRLRDRGLLRPSMCADIVIFDEGRVRDRATFEEPHQYAEGIDCVIVNGSIVLQNGVRTKSLPGNVLRFGKDIPPLPLTSTYV